MSQNYRCPECGQQLPREHEERAPQKRPPRLDCQAERSRPRLVTTPAMPKAIQPECTDHALIRYIERVMGVDVKSIRNEIMTKSVIAAIKNGATAVVVNGYKMPVSGEGKIITVLGRTMSKDRRRFHKRRRPRDEIAEYFEDLAEELVG